MFWSSLMCISDCQDTYFTFKISSWGSNALNEDCRVIPLKIPTKASRQKCIYLWQRFGGFAMKSSNKIKIWQERMRKLKIPITSNEPKVSFPCYFRESSRSSWMEEKRNKKSKKRNVTWNLPCSFLRDVGMMYEMFTDEVNACLGTTEFTTINSTFSPVIDIKGSVREDYDPNVTLVYS